MKKLIVIGGGIAGLSAAIYAKQSGFDVEIYEKNEMLGGECTGWNRQGYHIDNCIHWVTGCREEDGVNKIWRNIGAIDDDTKLYREPFFYKTEIDGVTLHFWNDVEKTRAEFLAVAPEDSDELNKFFDSVKLSECVQIPAEKSIAEMSVVEYMKFGMKMAPMGRVIKEYGKLTVGELAARYKNPYIRSAMSCYFNNIFNSISFLSSCGFFTSGTAAIPYGGSVGLVKRIEKRFIELGGVIHTGMPAVKINIEGKEAKSVTFENKTTVPCDAVICASDFSVTFQKLLGEKYMDKNLKKMYNDNKNYRVSSGFNASFGVIGEENFSAESGSTIFSSEEYSVATQKLNFVGMRVYDYDNELYPKDKRVIQCNILQSEEDYEYWKSIYDDKEKYNAEKLRVAKALEERIIKHCPELKNRLILLCTYSPVTFTKWCGAYMGAYMSFMPQIGAKSLYAKCSIRGLSNVFAASQWLSCNGGLPIAATSGKFAVDKLKEKIKV